LAVYFCLLFNFRCSTFSQRNAAQLSTLQSTGSGLRSYYGLPDLSVFPGDRRFFYQILSENRMINPRIYGLEFGTGKTGELAEV